MKRIIMLLLVLVVGLTLSACGNTNEEYDPLDDGVLKVGMDLRWAPFEMKDTNGDPQGISVEVAKALGEYLDVEVEIVDLEFGSLIASLNARDIDVIIASFNASCLPSSGISNSFIIVSNFKSINSYSLVFFFVL